jgi:hypothetical protein
MGTCTSQLTINKDVYLTMKANPDSKTLLVFQLHYDMYDAESKKQIDELSQIYISSDHSIHADIGVANPGLSQS